LDYKAEEANLASLFNFASRLFQQKRPKAGAIFAALNLSQIRSKIKASNRGRPVKNFPSF
jgi:hypothetical protein